MKTWHWIVIGGIALVGGYLLLRQSNAVTVVAGEKVGTGTGAAGAPPLPNLTYANPTTGKLFAFPSLFLRGVSL